MKAVKVTIAKKEYYLYFNGNAMFESRDKYGGIEQLNNALDEKTREGFAAICDTAALLAEQGELTRRYCGYDPAEFITAETIKNIIQPPEILDLLTAIFRAIQLGFGAEIDREKEDEIDIGLAELNQKKTD